MKRMPRMCAREGCGDTDTKPVMVAGFGGKAYVLDLCPTHEKDLTADGIIEREHNITTVMFLNTLMDEAQGLASTMHACKGDS